MNNLLKKLLSSIIICLTLVISNYLPVNALNEDYNNVINNVLQRIQTMENQEVELIKTRVLLDVELEPNYLLLIFKEGYAISSIENGIISEYSLSTDNIPYFKADFDDILIYGGPFNYLITNNQKFDLDTEKINKSEISKKNQEFLNLKSEAINVETTKKTTRAASYVGISKSRFSKYSSGKWINSKSNYSTSQAYSANGICGSISSAILLAYYDDYVNDSIVPSLSEQDYLLLQEHLSKKCFLELMH